MSCAPARVACVQGDNAWVFVHEDDIAGEVIQQPCCRVVCLQKCTRDMQARIGISR